MDAPAGFDLRTRTTLVCGALAITIAASTLLRARKQRVHLLFAAFAGDIGLWYVCRSLSQISGEQGWEQASVAVAVLLPNFALRLFESIVPRETGVRSHLTSSAAVLAVPLLVLGVWFEQLRPVRALVFVYVVTLISAGLYRLYKIGQSSQSRETQRRVLLLVIIGTLAAFASSADLALAIGFQPPPVGAVLSVVFLFALAQALRHERLLDAYEMVARLLPATVLAFLIAIIFYVLVKIFGEYNTYINAVLAAVVILVLLEPLRASVEENMRGLFFRERVDLERAVAETRQRLVHTLTIEEMSAIVMQSLEQSRRATAAALYLRDEAGSDFGRVASFGARSPERIEAATARALLERLEQGPVALESVERESKAARGTTQADAAGPLLASAEVLGALRAGHVVAVRSEAREIIGLLVVVDERVREAFSVEEIGLLVGLAGQVGIVVENSRAYEQMKERDRLALLGQMAAGIAHEVRNPLGAIKGAAQILSEEPANEGDASSREFLGIILEEVDRLDRVVGSVLDLARSQQGAALPTDVNAIVKRTLQVLSSERAAELQVEVSLDDEIPRVAIEPEQLRQVVMNLYRNAAQAMKNTGRISITTRVRFGRGTRPGTRVDEPFVELTVADNGPGISQSVLANLFTPFFTTKEKGTGLGLAISQRIVQNVGGRIEVRSFEGKGSIFAVILPTVDPEARPASVPPPPVEPREAELKPKKAKKPKKKRAAAATAR